jgi:hypothetical protein
MRLSFAAVLALATLLCQPVVAEPRTRLTPDETAALARGGAGAGASGLPGIETTILSGDPDKPGIYTIRVMVPAHRLVKPHTHRDDRTATVVSGVWWLAYGSVVNAADFKPLPPGSFYTEPAATAHYARTGDQFAVVLITGYGPSDTVYVDAADDPRDR